MKIEFENVCFGFVFFLGEGNIHPVARAAQMLGGKPFCHELDIGWVHIGQWILSILAISDELFWRKSVFCVFTL